MDRTATSSTSGNCLNSSTQNAASGRPWSRGIHVGTPATLAANECANAGIALPTLEERGAGAGRHEYEMLIDPETVRIARLITRPSFKDWIQNPALPAEERRDRVASEVATTLFRTGESHRRRRAAQRIENTLRRLSRRGIVADLNLPQRRHELKELRN